MRKDYLPRQVALQRFADRATELRGLLSITKMERLHPALLMTEGDVKVEAKFGIDEDGISFMKGTIETTLTLQCQRCMEPLIYEIMSDFAYGIIKREEEVNTLPEYYDPVILENDLLDIQGVIEEELIISLPIVALHAPENCKVQLPFMADTTGVVETKKANPFDVIAVLKGEAKDKF